jgi:hypothetical protein
MATTSQSAEPPTDASATFAMYAAAPHDPAGLITMVAIYKCSASALLVLGVLAGRMPL